jgi:hypothetical protein
VRKLNSRSLEKMVGGHAAVAMMENDCAPESRLDVGHSGYSVSA